jgi:phosphoribosylformylglycinamidine synthase
MADADLSVTRLGRCGGTELTVDGLFSIPVDELRDAYDATLPALFG